MGEDPEGQELIPENKGTVGWKVPEAFEGWIRHIISNYVLVPNQFGTGSQMVPGTSTSME